MAGSFSASAGLVVGRSNFQMKSAAESTTNQRASGCMDTSGIAPESNTHAAGERRAFGEIANGHSNSHGSQRDSVLAMAMNPAASNLAAMQLRRFGGRRVARRAAGRARATGSHEVMGEEYLAGFDSPKHTQISSNSVSCSNIHQIRNTAQHICPVHRGALGGLQ